MASLDLTMVLKLNDKATRKMERFNRVLDKTKKKLREIGKIQSKNAKASGGGSGASSGGGVGVGGAAIGAGAAGAIAAGSTTAVAGISAISISLISLVKTATKFELVLANIIVGLKNGIAPMASLSITAKDLSRHFADLDKTAKDAQKGVKKVGDEAKKTGDNAKKGATGLTKFRIGLLAIVAVVGITLKNIISTGREFETLRATLSSVIPSTDNVAEAFAFITSVAKQLPATVQEVTTSFIRMQALGLAPTEEKLISFGNTAAASGKTILQFVEAVADAVVGENERLKEFGIKARVDADKVKFTFRGVTTEVENTSIAISKFLVDIGKSGAFAGAATKQMETLDGAISNLGVATDSLSDNIFQAMAPALKWVVSLLTDFVEWVNKAFVGVRKWIVFTIGGFDQLLIRMKAFGQRISFLNADTKKINAERDAALKVSRDTVATMVAELDALINLDDAAKKYSKTLDERAAAQANGNKAATDSTILIEGSIHQLQTLNEFTQELIDSSADQVRSLENAMDAQSELDELYQDGIITQEVYLESLARLDEMLGVEIPETVSELSEFWKEAFRNMQGDLAGFFADATTKKFSSFRDAMKSLASDFAKTINRMVAQWLAAKVLTAGFGIFGADVGSGPRGFADGGRPPVNVPSIVGERGPEIFVPDSAGTIVPNEQMGSKIVNINITAMDSQDVMRSLEQNKRGITEMVFGTSRTFNIGTA